MRNPLLVNGVGEDVGVTVMMGKVIRPLRSVDPSQTEYQGLIEITEEGWWQVMGQDFTFKALFFLGKLRLHHPFSLLGCFRWN